MPIFEATLRMPLLTALTKFFCAYSGPTSVGRKPSACRSAIGVQGQVRVDRAGAVAEQQAEVVHLAGLAGLDDQAALGAHAAADEVVVDARGRQQRRDGGVVAVDAAVAEDQQ
jgi:hypothetical protein